MGGMLRHSQVIHFYRQQVQPSSEGSESVHREAVYQGDEESGERCRGVCDKARDRGDPTTRYILWNTGSNTHTNTHRHINIRSQDTQPVIIFIAVCIQYNFSLSLSPPLQIQAWYKLPILPSPQVFLFSHPLIFSPIPLSSIERRYLRGLSTLSYDLFLHQSPVW